MYLPFYMFARGARYGNRYKRHSWWTWKRANPVLRVCFILLCLMAVVLFAAGAWVLVVGWVLLWGVVKLRRNNCTGRWS